MEVFMKLAIVLSFSLFLSFPFVSYSQTSNTDNASVNKGTKAPRYKKRRPKVKRGSSGLGAGLIGGAAGLATGVLGGMVLGAVTSEDQDKGITYLHYAARDGHVEGIQALIEAGEFVDVRDIYEQTPLHYATEKGHSEAVKALLEHGANLNAKYGTHNNRTPLHLAVFENHLEVVKILLDYGASINAGYGGDNRTPLYEATQKGYLEIVHLLIEKGADVNKPSVIGYLNDPTESLYTPLMIASINGHLEVVKALVEAGADVNAQNRNEGTALYYADRYDHDDVHEYLEGQGAECVSDSTLFASVCWF